MLTTHAAVQHVTTTNKENDSPTIVREGGVEKQSTMERFTRITDSETDIGQPRRISEITNTQATEPETNIGLSQRKTENNTCTQCQRTFGTERGLKIHQGKKCLRKTQ